MPKFSIVIPVYNVEKYIKRTLDSVFSQTYQSFEVIVVNDGCTDQSIELAKEYKVKIVNEKHVGVSEARNIGAKYATGEYLVFLDSDDYWEKGLLEHVTKSLENKPDLVRFQARTVTEDGEITNYEEAEFEGLNGIDAFQKISKFHFVESIWCYAIKRTYYEKEKFQFKKDRIHEDFGLTPLIVIKAKKINSISYIGYNYFRRTGSIMNTPKYSWTQKKVKDFYYHYQYLRKEIEKVEGDTSIFKSFIANSMIMKICELNKKDYKNYKKKLKEENVYSDLLTDTKVRKIKKWLVSLSPRIYYKIMQ